MEVLTSVAGAITIRPEDMKGLVALRVDERHAVILTRGWPEDKEIISAVRRRVEYAGLVLLSTNEATEAMIAMCYARGINAKKPSLGEGDSDAENWIRELFERALEKGASDIHINVFKEYAKVEFRIHGDLTLDTQISRAQAEEYSRSMYVKADEDSRRGNPIFDPNMYMDCAITAMVQVKQGDEYEMRLVRLRWASGPVAPNSWDIVLRVLSSQTKGQRKDLRQLGVSEKQIGLLNYALKFPTGMILITGATGSGKSTTMSAMLEQQFADAKGKKSFRTIEDPVETILAGGAIRATPVVSNKSEPGKDAGKSGFAMALKAAMRQDPDHLMLGEIRDHETAKNAQHATQTGHKMYSTLHTNTAIDAIPRLTDIGMELSVLTSKGFINAIINQKLLPTICPNCSIGFNSVQARVQMTKELVSLLERDYQADLPLLRFRGPGCEKCVGGVNGRTVVMEIIIPDEVMLQLWSEQKYNLARDYWEGGLCKYEGDKQMKNTLDHALEKMLDGDVSPVDVDYTFGHLNERCDHVASAQRYQAFMNRANKS